MEINPLNAVYKTALNRVPKRKMPIPSAQNIDLFVRNTQTKNVDTEGLLQEINRRSEDFAQRLKKIILS